MRQRNRSGIPPTIVALCSHARTFMAMIVAGRAATEPEGLVLALADERVSTLVSLRPCSRLKCVCTHASKTCSRINQSMIDHDRVELALSFLALFFSLPSPLPQGTLSARTRSGTPDESSPPLRGRLGPVIGVRPPLLWHIPNIWPVATKHPPLRGRLDSPCQGGNRLWLHLVSIVFLLPTMLVWPAVPLLSSLLTLLLLVCSFSIAHGPISVCATWPHAMVHGKSRTAVVIAKCASTPSGPLVSIWLKNTTHTNGSRLLRLDDSTNRPRLTSMVGKRYRAARSLFCSSKSIKLYYLLVVCYKTRNLEW